MNEIGVEYIGFGGVISLLSSHNIPDNLSEIGVEYVEVRHSLHFSDCVLQQNLNFICWGCYATLACCVSKTASLGRGNATPVV